MQNLNKKLYRNVNQYILEEERNIFKKLELLLWSTSMSGQFNFPFITITRAERNSSATTVLTGQTVTHLTLPWTLEVFCQTSPDRSGKQLQRGPDASSVCG